MGIDDHSREDGHIADCKGVDRTVLHMAYCSVRNVRKTKRMALHTGHIVLRTFQDTENEYNVVRKPFRTNRNPHQNDKSECTYESNS